MIHNIQRLLDLGAFHDVSIEDIRRHGALVVVEDFDPQTTYRLDEHDGMVYDLEGNVAAYESPLTVEPNDIFTRDELSASDTLTGQRLIDLLSQHRATRRLLTNHPQHRVAPTTAITTTGEEVTLLGGTMYHGTSTEVITAAGEGDYRGPGEWREEQRVYLTGDREEATEYALLAAERGGEPVVLEVDVSGLRVHLDPEAAISDYDELLTSGHFAAVQELFDVYVIGTIPQWRMMRPPPSFTATPFQTPPAGERDAGDVAREVLEYTLRNEGGTYSLLDSRFHEGSGYGVGFDEKDGRGVVVTVEEFKRDGVAILELFVERNRDVLTQPDVHLGTWYEKDAARVHLDPSEVIYDLEEAIRLGKERNQIAIWDFAENAMIATYGAGSDAAGEPLAFKLPSVLPQQPSDRGALMRFPVADVSNAPKPGVVFRAAAGRTALLHFSRDATVERITPAMAEPLWMVDGGGILNAERVAAHHVYVVEVPTERLYDATFGVRPTDEELLTAGYVGWFVGGSAGRGRLLTDQPVEKLGVMVTQRGARIDARNWREFTLPAPVVSTARPPAPPTIEWVGGEWVVSEHPAVVTQALAHGHATVLAYVDGPLSEVMRVTTNPSVPMRSFKPYAEPSLEEVVVGHLQLAAVEREDPDAAAWAYEYAAARLGVRTRPGVSSVGPVRMAERVMPGTRVVSLAALLEVSKFVSRSVPERLLRSFNLPLLALVMGYQAIEVDNRYAVIDDEVPVDTQAAALISGDRSDLEEIRTRFPEVDFTYIRYPTKEKA